MFCSIATVVILLASTVQAFSPAFRGQSRIFLDTAVTKEWEELLPTGIFHGVTTNPTLLERAGEECTIDNIHRLADKAFDSHPTITEFMCQAWGSTTQEMFDCGMKLSEPDRSRIVIKVPVTQKGVKAASMLIKDGCRVCLTACYNHQQALIASSVGAEYLAPYLGRMTDSGLDGTTECLKMQQITDGLKSSTRILVASIRDSQTMVDLAAEGMETFTIAPDIARQLFIEPLTDEAAEVFEIAAASNNGSSSSGETITPVEKEMLDPENEKSRPVMSYN